MKSKNDIYRKGSGITEAMILAILSTGSAVVYQLMQGGFDNVSQGAFTALAMAVGTLAMQILYKKRNGHL